LERRFSQDECIFQAVGLTARRVAGARGTFNSVSQLIDAIDTWVEHWNDDPEPFIWTKTPNEIIAKVRRGRAALTTVTKSATHH